jgi:CRISPR/Cas system-associated exonuclease Cas4 (RecB family)
MPFAGFICEVSGESITLQVCLICARSGAPGCDVGSPAIIAGIIRGQRPPDFALAAASDERQDLRLDAGFSVTELLACPRKTRLLAEYDWWEKPTRLYYAYRGNLMHAEAEKYLSEDPLAAGEARLFWFMRFSGKTIGLSGQPDLLLYDSVLNGWKIIDYKTIKEIPSRTYRYVCPSSGKTISETPFRVRGKSLSCAWCNEHHPLEDVRVEELLPQPRGSHALQLQLYALLVEKNIARIAQAVNRQLAETGSQVSIPTDALVIAAELVYLDMSSQKRISVDLLPRPERLDLLKGRLALHIQDDLPAVLTNPSDLWQCDYCPVREICARLYGGPVGKGMLAAETLETATV